MTQTTDRFAPTWKVAFRSSFWGVLFLVFWTAAAIYARSFDGRIGFGLPVWLQEPGLLLAGVGAAVSVACVTVFTWKGHGTPAPFDGPRVFVSTGPYKHSRNPMLTGFGTLLFGLALYWRSMGTLGLFLLFAVLAEIMVRAWEEPHLRRCFGDTYYEYCRNVPRWIPRL
jgi:protein-S-isoprenylcysteine O-methyltransferase Ste14